MQPMTTRALLASLLLGAAGSAQALVRTWPGPAPCDTTLQACVNASAAADTVLVAQAAPIAESILLNKPFVLRAAAGFRPVFDVDRSISGSVSAAGTWTWQVEGFRLRRGFVSLNITGGTQANVIVRDNRIDESPSGAALISIFKGSAIATNFNYDVSSNQLNYFWDINDGALRAALQILDSGSGTTSGTIRDNRITAAGNASIGILVSTLDRVHRVGIAGNHVLGGRRGSIYLRQGSVVGPAAGSLTALVTSNVVRSVVPGSRSADGIRAEVFDGSLTVDVQNNTVVDATRGFAFTASAGTVIGGTVRGNLFAYLFFNALQRPTGGAVTDSANLFFQTPDGPSTPGLSADSIFADPLLRSPPEDLNLLPGSPAIDRLLAGALQIELGNFGLPATDGNGLRRIKLDNSVSKALPLDIGALEAGDTTFLHRVPTVAPGNVSLLNNTAVDGFSAALPQYTQNWNPNRELGIYNDHPLSLRYLSSVSRWQLRQESLLTFTPGARFNIFAPGSSSGRFLHTNTAANISGSATRLDNPDLNGRQDYILMVTRNPGTGTVVDLNAPTAVNYAGGGWSIVRLGGVIMPVSGGFNVYFQPPSSNAFRHLAGVGNTFGSVSDIDHPLLNGNPCASVHVTQATDLAVSNDHHIGVYYEASSINRWSIFNQDLANIPLGAEFHVVVDPQSYACTIDVFANGFE